MVFLSPAAPPSDRLRRITNGAANDLERVIDRPLDGVRVRHVGGRARAHDARRQLRALGGDEAATRLEQARLTDYAYEEAHGC